MVKLPGIAHAKLLFIVIAASIAMISGSLYALHANQQPEPPAKVAQKPQQPKKEEPAVEVAAVETPTTEQPAPVVTMPPSTPKPAPTATAVTTPTFTRPPMPAPDRTFKVRSIFYGIGSGRCSFSGRPVEFDQRSGSMSFGANSRDGHEAGMVNYQWEYEIISGIGGTPMLPPPGYNVPVAADARNIGILNLSGGYGNTFYSFISSPDYGYRVRVHATHPNSVYSDWVNIPQTPVCS